MKKTETEKKNKTQRSIDPKTSGRTGEKKIKLLGLYQEIKSMKTVKKHKILNTKGSADKQGTDGTHHGNQRRRRRQNTKTRNTRGDLLNTGTTGKEGLFILQSNSSYIVQFIIWVLWRIV